MNLSDQTWVSEQYKNASNLHARIGLHERFSTNAYGWHPWVFDHLDLPAQSSILELGCGSGLLWVKNMDRIPEGWEIMLTDLSPGMLEEAQGNLRNSQFRFEVADVQAIPFDAETFDAVIANHMLYHVPDRPRAFAEIRRVMKPGGFFYAAANGRTAPGGSRDIRNWIMNPDAYKQEDTGFSLETGGAELSQWFSNVAQHRYEDALAITEAAPLVEYVRSGKRTSDEELRAFEQIVKQKIAEQGVIHIPKSPGMFISQKLP